jgi:hypothetical protein
MTTRLRQQMAPVDELVLATGCIYVTSALTPHVVLQSRAGTACTCGYIREALLTLELQLVLDVSVCRRTPAATPYAAPPAKYTGL